MFLLLLLLKVVVLNVEMIKIVINCYTELKHGKIKLRKIKSVVAEGE